MTYGEAVEIVIRLRDDPGLSRRERDALAALCNNVDQDRYDEEVEG